MESVQTKTASTSKVRQAFNTFKKKYDGVLLFFRFDDFYEAFFEDAEACSQICGLGLIEREKDGEFIPLFSIPFWFIERYTEKMRQAGYRVGLLEQVEISTRTGESVKRDVARIFQPVSEV